MMVEWSERAAAELLSIRGYLNQTSPAYAQLIAEKIIRRTEQLADQPLTGAEVPEYQDETLREVFERPYRIMYRVSAQRIQIVAIIHASRQLPDQAP